MAEVIKLPHNFTLRDYQREPWNAVMHPDFQRGVMVVPRRNGKDIVCWNLLIAKAMQEVGLYYYMAPFYNQVRQIIWEGFDRDGRRFFDYIPKMLIKNATKIDMRIDLINGSQIKLQGSDQIDRIVGTNPRGIVFTEYSLHKPGAWEYLRPILAENGGWAIFNGTPRGLNHFYDIYNSGSNNPNWYTQYLTRDDTGIPSLEAIEEDRESGMPEELIKQEYYSSFLTGSVGNYYGNDIESLRNEGKITRVPYEPSLDVYTAWDLGYDDAMAIWFAQVHGKEMRLIDYIEENNKGMNYFIKQVKEREYIYEEHFAPHDIEVHELSDGITRKQKAEDLGMYFTTTAKLGIEDGREMVRNLLPQCWFDSVKCSEGIKALTHYKKKFDEKAQKYSDTHVKDWAVHGADAFRYLAINSDSMNWERANWNAPKVIRSINQRELGYSRRNREVAIPTVNRSIRVAA